MQSKRHSLEETIVSTTIGFAGSMLINKFVVPHIIGAEVSVGANLALTCVFTVWSISRGYVMRRIYNRRLHREYKAMRE